MKKIIALALVLCLTVSMVCFASAADFTDSALIDQQNTEAVTVLSEMGIIGGMGDGTFAPNGTLTRAQAAKIICCMVLGSDKANALTAAGAKFGDVPTSHWAAKFVNYCANKGIVSGVGNGKFGPNNKLTGYAFAKMLLVAALGYNAEKEGLVGADWEKNTGKLLTSEKLNTGITVSSRDMKRQDACHLALNCMFAGEESNPNDTLAFEVFGVTRSAGEIDKANYGRPTTIYVTEDSGLLWEGTDLIVGASPFYVASGKLTGGKIYTACGNVEVPTEALTVVRNGVTFNAPNFSNTITRGNSAVFDCTQYGLDTEIYYDAATNHYTIIELSNCTAKITDAISAVKSPDGSILEHGSVTLDNGLSCETDAFTEADIGTYALYRGMGKSTWRTVDNITEAFKPTIVKGTLTAAEGSTSVTVGGKFYNLSLNFAAVTGKTYLADGGNLGDTVNVVLDENNIAYAVYAD